MYKTNLFSTLVGFLIVIAPIPFEDNLLNDIVGYTIVGPWGFGLFYSLLFLNIILLIISIIIEYNIAKKDLIQNYSQKEIKKSFILVNLISYLGPIILYLWACILFGPETIYEYQYNKINISDLDNIKIIKSAFRPKYLSKQECNLMKKQLGIKAKCDTNKDYWAGAVAACGGV